MVAHGQPAGIEIPATDVSRAIGKDSDDSTAVEFYTKTFGWKFEAPKAGIPTNKMMTFETPGDVFAEGGVVTLVDEVSKTGATKVYLNVDDIQAAMDAIVKNGGKQLSDVIKMGDVATYQFFEDTEGNKYATTCPSKK